MKAPGILFVTKPLAAPWADSGRLLPYLVAKNLADLRISVMVPAGQPVDLPNVVSEEVYASGQAFSVPGGDKLRLMARLMGRATPPVVHFFFSPNRPTSMAARLVARRHRGVHMIQTIMSLPMKDRDLVEGIFADTVVVWSEHARRRVADIVAARGLSSDVVHIRPGIEPIEPIGEAHRRFLRTGFGLPPDGRIILYAGDLEFSTGATVTAAAVRMLADRMRAVFVFACRPKTPAASRVLKRIEADLAVEASAGRVRFMGQVGNFRDLLSCVDCQVLPVETTYAKTDIPLVVLEGLSAGVPAIVGTGTPMDELVACGAAAGVTPGDPRALADAVEGVFGSGGNCDTLAKAGRRYVLANHGAQAMAQAHAVIYRRLAG